MPDPAPRDVVPHQPREMPRLERGQPVTVTLPGRVLTDPDGLPIGVERNGTVTLPVVSTTADGFTLAGFIPEENQP